MRKVILYIAMSIDGYIADKDGGIGWLTGDGSSSSSLESYSDFYQTIDTVIMGYTTYNQIVTELSPDKWVYENKECYVITNRQLPSKKGITFTAESLTNLVARLKQNKGENIWICGGASIAKTLIDADMIDNYRISIIPTILGSGTLLFGNRDEQLRLKLISTKEENGIVELNYCRR